jgi:hypothetical protein
MELFYNYFIPAISLILLGTLPIYITRIILFLKREHFMLHINVVRMTMYIHAGSFLAVIITLLFYINTLGNVATYLFIVIGLLMAFFAIFYRYSFVHQKRHLYVVAFSKWNNRQAWQSYLDENKYNSIDISDGAYSYVTKIRFQNASKSDLAKLMKEFKDHQDLLHPFTSTKGLALFALQVAMANISVIGMILFFVYIPRL